MSKFQKQKELYEILKRNLIAGEKDGKPTLRYVDGCNDSVIASQVDYSIATVRFFRIENFGKITSWGANIPKKQNAAATVLKQVNHDIEEVKTKLNLVAHQMETVVGFIEGIKSARERAVKSREFYDMRVNKTLPKEQLTESAFTDSPDGY